MPRWDPPVSGLSASYVIVQTFPSWNHFCTALICSALFFIHSLVSTSRSLLLLLLYNSIVVMRRVVVTGLGAVTPLGVGEFYTIHYIMASSPSLSSPPLAPCLSGHPIIALLLGLTAPTLTTCIPIRRHRIPGLFAAKKLLGVSTWPDGEGLVNQ